MNRPARDGLRLPPQNLEAELGLIGSLLLDPAAIDELMPILRPEFMYRDTHRAALWAIIKSYGRHGTVDQLAVADELAAKFGGHSEALDVLTQAVQATPHAANAALYAEIVRQKAVKRDLIESLTETLRACYEDDDKTAEDLLSLAESSAFELADRQEGGESVGAGPVADECLDRMRRVWDGEVSGLSMGYPDLDGMTDGLAGGQLIILAARPSLGKSSLALNVATKVVLGVQATPTLFVSLEMSRLELGDKMLSALSGIGLYRLREGRLDPAERDRVEEARRALHASGRLWINDRSAQTPSTIASQARRLKRKHGLGFLVVDYMQLITPDADVDPRASRAEKVSTISGRLKALARHLDIPILALCQLNRNPERREDKSPSLADLRESGSLEQDADIVMLIHRPEFYDDQNRPGEADIIFAKNRMGRTGTVTLKFHGELSRFEEMSRGVGF